MLFTIEFHNDEAIVDFGNGGVNTGKFKILVSEHGGTVGIANTYSASVGTFPHCFYETFVIETNVGMTLLGGSALARSQYKCATCTWFVVMSLAPTPSP